MINQEDPTFKAHFQDQLEAAYEQTWETTQLLNKHLIEDLGKTIKTSVYLDTVINGYILEKWTWFSTLDAVKKGEIPFTPPETCSHIDPLHPAAWMGLLNYPNKFWCMQCASDRVLLDQEKDAHVCDRCLNDNTHKFYDFALPVGNIQIIGSICGMCVAKVEKELE